MSEHEGSQASRLKVFFEPRSIAIIGASCDPLKPGGVPVEALLKRGYAGNIYPVNPRYQELLGLPCYPSVTKIPGSVDLAIISVPAAFALESMEQCAAKGIKAVILFTSGFAEVGPDGLELQSQLIDLAAEHDILMLGPNCVGLINLNNSVMASFAQIVDLEPVSPKSLGFVSQSGAYGVMIYRQALSEGVGFSSFVSVGNEANLEFADFLNYLLDDPETKVVGGYLEGERNGLKLRQVAEKALEREKPILIMKVGRSQSGSQAASSHTGSLAGNDLIYNAFFQQMGIIRIESLQELTSFVIIHRSGRKPRGRNVAILSLSGGGGVVLADKCELLGLNVHELTGKTRVELESVLPAFASARNPIDLTSQGATDPTLLGKCLRAILADEKVDSVLINIDFSEENGPMIIQDIIDAYEASDKPILFFPFFFSDSPVCQVLIQKMKDKGIPVLMDSLQGVQALYNNVRFHEKIEQHKRRRIRQGALESQFIKTSSEPIVPVNRLLNDFPRGPLTEYDAKKLLAQAGIPITREELAKSPEEAIELAKQIGYPVVLKIQSRDILHKTESGGIALNLNGDEEVREAYHTIMERTMAYRSDAEIQGVLVQEMLSGGVEVIIGIASDPVFGPVVMTGLGGILVEALQDVSFRVAPFNEDDAIEMLKDLKGYRVLQGLRGKPPVDLEILKDVILKVSRLVVEHPEIRELDINPLVVFPTGAKVVDALIISK